MYKGEITDELKELYLLYHEKYGCDPDFYEGFHYDSTPRSYNDFIADIRLALETDQEIPDLYPAKPEIVEELGFIKGGKQHK